MPDLRHRIKVLEHQPIALQLLATVVIPVAYGALTGLALGWSAPVYGIMLLLSVVGGFFAGYEHIWSFAGLLRGTWGAAMFTAGVLLAHDASGRPAKVKLPEPLWVFPFINVLVGAVFGALGAWRREVWDRRDAAPPGPDRAAGR